MASPLTVLLLEDDEAQATLAQSFLARHGITCRLAGTLKDSVAILMNERVDAIVMDLNLPDGSALDLLGLLPASPNARAKVVVSSGVVKEDMDQHAGIDRVFEKPYRFRDLVTYLQTEILQRI